MEDANGDVVLNYDVVGVTVDGATEHGGDERAPMAALFTDDLAPRGGVKRRTG